MHILTVLSFMFFYTKNYSMKRQSFKQKKSNFLALKHDDSAKDEQLRTFITAKPFLFFLFLFL